jgi:hypothetical protein
MITSFYAENGQRKDEIGPVPDSGYIVEIEAARASL